MSPTALAQVHFSGCPCLERVHNRSKDESHYRQPLPKGMGWDVSLRLIDALDTMVRHAAARVPIWTWEMLSRCLHVHVPSPCQFYSN
jgi:hypothetical protein